MESYVVWNFVPNQDEGQSKKRKAPEESAKRAKTVVENTTTATRNRVGARNAGKNKQGTASKSSMSIIFLNFNVTMAATKELSNVIIEIATRVEFPNLIIPNATLSSSRTTPPHSRAETNSTNNTTKQRTNVPGSSRSATVAAKKAAPKAAAARKRAREEDEDERMGTSLRRRNHASRRHLRLQNQKKIFNHAPSQRLDVFVCGEGSSGELGLSHGKTAIGVKRPRLNHNLSASKAGVAHLVSVECTPLH